MTPPAPANIAEQNARLLELCDSLAGTPYIWFGKGEEVGVEIDGKLHRVEAPSAIPGKPGFVLDCSGGVTYPLWRVGGPDLRWTHHADRLYQERPPVKVPVPGDYAFYGSAGKAIHVMTVSRVLHSGGVMVMGPSGGDHTCTTLDRAFALMARWTSRRTHTYRSDFLGFRAGFFTQS